MTAIPYTIHTEANDKLMAVFDQVISHMMIQLELSFQRPLDAERLAQATTLCLDAEPVLGCRFVSHPKAPYWERSVDEHTETFQLFQDIEAYRAFQNTPLKAKSGPQLQVGLFRPAQGEDMLLLKVGHAAADAAGVKQIAARLSEIYAQLDDDPSYRPAVNLQGARGIKEITRHLPWRVLMGALFQLLREPLRLLFSRPTHQLLAAPRTDASTPFLYVQRHFDSKRVDRLRVYGRQHTATFNDLFMTAFLRALSKHNQWNHQDHLKLACTVDLRRYHPEGRLEGIANMSEMVYLGLGTDPGKSFEAAVTRIATTTKELTRRYIGLKELLSKFVINLVPYGKLERQLNQMIEKAKTEATPRKPKQPNIGLTNMGPIDPAAVTFGHAPRQAVLLPPPIFAPGFTAGLSGFDGSLTLSAGTSDCHRETVGQFFDQLMDELPG